MTKISEGRQVWSNDFQSGGEVTKVDREQNIATVRLYDEDKEITTSIDDLSIDEESYLPMWSTMWTFGSSLDEYWVTDNGGLEIMSDLGFRIYECEYLGIVFGIDGAGYNFYSHHWTPLYDAIGFRWHEIE